MSEQDLLDDTQYSSDRKRHGCVTAWLIFMIAANALSAILYLARTEYMAKMVSNEPSTKGMIVLLGLIGVANIYFAFLLLRWKRQGFYGIIGTSAVTFMINLSLGLGIGQSILGLVGIGILYAILQIKQDGNSTWSQLD